MTTNRRAERERRRDPATLLTRPTHAFEERASQRCLAVNQCAVLPVGELEALERDAARYRWLRVEVDNGATETSGALVEIFGEAYDGEEILDAAIDTAMVAEQSNLTRDAVGRDGRGDPVGDPYEEATIARKAR